MSQIGPPTTPPPRNDESLYEYLDGHWVAMPPMSALSGWVASHLISHIDAHARKHDLGECVQHMLFCFPLNPARCRRPDGAFISYERWPKHRPISVTAEAWQVVPDLTLEVLSPADSAECLLERLGEFFHAGVKAVWVVSPIQRLIHVYDSFESIRVLSGCDELDGGPIVPGLKLAVADAFPH